MTRATIPIRRPSLWMLFVAWLVAVASSSLAPASRAQTYAFDKASTHLGFSFNHLGLSRRHGRFLDLTGTLSFDPVAPESGRVAVTIQAASIWTGVSELDELLRSPDYFDAATYPIITFRSSEARKSGERTEIVVGELTMRGVTKPVTLAVTWNFAGEHPLAAVNPNYSGRQIAGFSAKTTLKRSDWGISRGVPLISDEVEIVIEAELPRQ